MIEDRQYLKEFCRNRSESAFCHLVERHLAMVYSAALRLVNGDAHLAQDVAQLVFTNLATKASSLPPGVVLPGWLHRDTRFTALEVLRKERRRSLREQVAFSMQSLENQEDIDWSRLRPFLDETIDKLHSDDRHAILLRFFDNRTFAEIGAALGLSEDGARKRVARSLEQLRGRLASRGIKATASALSVTLILRAVERTPSGLANQISAAAIAGATGTSSTAGILLLMSSAKTTPFLVAGAVLLLIVVSGELLV